MAKSSTPTIVAVGHLCKDTIGIVPAYPNENTSVHISSPDIQAGGGASQAIVAVARLGGNAGYIGVVGTDETGTFLQDGLKEEHVDVSLLRRAEGISAFSFVCVSATNAKRTLFNYHDELPPIEFDTVAEAYIANAKYLHLDGTKYIDAINAAKLAKKLGVPVSLDGSSMQKDDNNKNIALAKLADILIMNEEYPCKLMGTDDREKALKEIVSWGAKIVMSTLGEKGSVAVVDGELVYFPAFHIEPVDTTGAGDVFHGAFLRALELGYSLEDCVKFSSAVSAINCQTLGGRRGIPTFEQTWDFINTHEFKF